MARLRDMIRKHDYKYTTTLADYAIVNIGSYGKAQSIHSGRVTMISQRGINIKLQYGEPFVKWCNVKQILTPHDFYRHQFSESTE